MAPTFWLALVLGCSEPPSPPPVAPPPAPPQVAPKAVPLPQVAATRSDRVARIPTPLARSADLDTARATLAKVVHDHAREPGNAWAIGHAMLALGPEVELTNGTKAIDYLFVEYGERVDVADDHAVRFPRKRGKIRIEPHTDLLLKGITEGGVSPTRDIAVAGELTTPSQLYRHSLWRAWVDGADTSLDSFDDLPWALQGLSAWAPDDLAWTAKGGHDMTLDGMTHSAVEHLSGQSALLHSARERGAMPQKDGQGIVGYACGGQHLIQGVAYAHARGFGEEGDREAICKEKDLLRWRIDHELNSVDPLLLQHGSDPNVAIVLLNQRFKFLGHYLETASKFAAYEVCEWTDDDQQALQRAADELVRTVDAVRGIGLWDDLEGRVRKNAALDPYRPSSGGREQVFLDYIGDAAHAVRGIDLATGQAGVRF